VVNIAELWREQGVFLPDLGVGLDGTVLVPKGILVHGKTREIISLSIEKSTE